MPKQPEQTKDQIVIVTFKVTDTTEFNAYLMVSRIFSSLSISDRISIEKIETQKIVS